MKQLYHKKRIKTILFRLDANSSIGLGHLMRSLVFAKKLQKSYPHAQIVFLTTSLTKHLKQKIKNYGFIHKQLKNSSFYTLVKTLKTLKPSLIVIDHYGIGYTEEQKVKKLTNTPQLCFDDTYQKHFCDVIINHNISACKQKYKKHAFVKVAHIPPLLREEFYKEKRKKREKIYDYFIAMGGVDSNNITLKILQELPQQTSIAVVTTSANANLQTLQSYIKKQKTIKLFVNADNVAKLLNQSKFAIITPSVIVHEVLFLKVDFLAIQTAKNQYNMFHYLKHKGYNVFDISSFIKWITHEKTDNLC